MAQQLKVLRNEGTGRGEAFASAATPVVEVAGRKPKRLAEAGAEDMRALAVKVLAQALVRQVEAVAEGRRGANERRFVIAEEVRHFEAELIRAALTLTGGRQRRAARFLGMSKTALNAKIKRYQIVLTE
jgi:DNA-binding NtrC family response regulator